MSSENKDQKKLKESIKKIFGKAYTNVDNVSKLYMDSFNKQFPPYITIDDITNKLEYKYCKDATNNLGLHIGQRKLLLSEVQFLTVNKQKYCIYVGSAPSHKTHLLSQLFPKIKLILVDPNIFELKITETNKMFRDKPHDDIMMLYYGFPTKSLTYKTNKIIEDMDSAEADEMLNFIKTSDHKIFIIEDYMTDKLALIFKKLGSHSFISDIRSNITNTHPLDIDIVWNSSMVHNWITILKPKISMVKFRIPYFNAPEDFSVYDFAQDAFKTSKALKKGSIDFIKNYNERTFKLPKATLYLQAWAGSSSTEMRGWIEKKDIYNIVNYDISDIENTLFYYNRIMRINYHENKYADKELHFCNCNDCAIESVIWQAYINKLPKATRDQHDVKYYVNMSNISTSRLLSDKHTQNIYNVLNIDTLDKIINIKNKSTEYGKAVNRGNTGLKMKK